MTATKKLEQLETELTLKVDNLEVKMTGLESKLDLIANNHLHHIQQYITWILAGGFVLLLSQIWMIARLV
jgi:hypothetical protein